MQDTFCAGTTCTISVIYDQSANGNHLTKSPPGGWLTNGGLEANATAAKITANGHPVYGVYTTSNFDNSVGAVGYRNNSTKGVATGDDPEAMYMLVSGKHYNQWCCFDYGNAETNDTDDGKATMEAVYFGNSTQWGMGSGSGPWVMADLEDGVYAGGSTAAPATNTSLVANYVTAMLKGPSGNRFVLKGGDAQSGALATKYDGARPAGYSPMKKQGAIILGIGGDNSHTGEGTFFEGCITSGLPSDAVDERSGKHRCRRLRSIRLAVGSRAVGGRIEEQLPEAARGVGARVLGDEQERPGRIGGQSGPGGRASADEAGRRDALHGRHEAGNAHRHDADLIGRLVESKMLGCFAAIQSPKGLAGSSARRELGTSVVWS